MTLNLFNFLFLNLIIIFLRHSLHERHYACKRKLLDNKVNHCEVTQAIAFCDHTEEKTSSNWRKKFLKD